jgi:CRISPR/Cas system CSM-associated protein Csm2 small subunit
MIDNQELRASYLRQNNDAQYLDMRDEISLTHAMIERRLSMIKTDADVMCAIGPFTQLVQRLESMKISLMKLQTQLGLVLGKDELRQLASHLAQILDEELEGMEDKENRMDRMLERLVIAIEDAGKKKEE